MAVAATAVVNHAGYVIILRRWAGIPVRVIACANAPAAVAGVAVAIVVGATRQLLLGVDAPLVMVLIAEILVGTLTLGPMFWFGPLRRSLRDIVERLERARFLEQFDRKWPRLMCTLRR